MNASQKDTHLTSVFDYVDFRRYLGDWIAVRKKTKTPVSFRQLGRAAGFSSPGYCQLVVRGERNLSETFARNLTSALQLSTAEADYFCLLVHFNQSKNLDQKKQQLEKMQALYRRHRPRSSSYIFAEEHRWFVFVILELASCKGFVLTVESAYKALGGRIEKKEIASTFDALTAKRFISKDETGAYFPLNPPQVKTPDEISSLYVRETHLQALRLGSEALRLPINEREFQNIALALSKEAFSLLKTRIKALTQEVLSEFAHDANADRVYYINLQAFPVTETVPPPRSDS